MKKFFVENQNIQNNQIIIKEDEFVHLSKVLRTKIGEEILCFCGDDWEYYCILEKIEKRFAVATILHKKKCLCNPKVNITVFQGLAKGEKLEFIIQKLTELGASKLVPFESDFTIAKEVRNKILRFDKISKEACKQCGRSKPIEICETIKLKNINPFLKNYDIVLFLNEKAGVDQTLSKVEKEILKSQSVAIIIGAEGGFSENEILELEKCGVTSVSLGKRILRTETACVAMTAYVSFLLDN